MTYTINKLNNSQASQSSTPSEDVSLWKKNQGALFEPLTL